MLVLLFGACAAPNAEIHLAPVFSRHTVPQYQHVEAVGGLLRYHRDPRSVAWTLAPLLWWEQEFLSRHVHADFLLGLGRYEWEPDRDRTFARLFPLWWYWSEIRPDGVRDTDWSFLMWLIGGGSSSDGEEDYLWVFPFGGTGKDILTYDSFRFVLWPLYVHNEKAGRESTHVLWPFFGWQGGTERGWRVFPFYGTAEWPGRYQRRFILWPFWSEADDDLDKTYPSRRWLLFPFYGRNRQDDWQATTVLWPFFGWSERPSTGYRSFQFWPLVKFHNGADDAPQRIRRVLPFWLDYEDPQTRYTAWLWPLFWHREDDFNGMHREGWLALPFFQRWRTERDAGGTDTLLRIWPFYARALRADGEQLVRALEPGLPGVFDPETLSHLFGSLYEFWTVRASQPQPRIHEERAFLNLYHAAESGGHRRWSVAGLGGRWTEPDGTGHWSLLFGLLRWRTGDDGGLEVPAFPGPGWPDLHRLPAGPADAVVTAPDENPRP